MCTLSYIPHPQGFTFTHNRDERSDRPTSQKIQKKSFGDKTIYFPQDLEAGGSWIGMRSDGRTACILNGGSKDYRRQPPYARSRGIVLLEYLSSESAESYFQPSRLEGIEPFTFIAKEGAQLYQIVHDEDESNITPLDASQKHIWSSTTLYTPEVRAWRARLFQEWSRQNPHPSAPAIRHFHRFGGKGDGENDLVMSRWGILRTLSITQIVADEQQMNMHYHILENDAVDQISL